MKRLLNYSKWIAINVGFAYIGYLGVFGGNAGFGRVFIFFSWIGCVLILLMTKYAEEMPIEKLPIRTTPIWMSVTYDLVITAVLVYAGWWFTAISYTLSGLYVGTMWDKIEKRRTDHIAALEANR